MEVFGLASTSAGLVSQDHPLADPSSWQVVLRTTAQKVVLWNSERNSLAISDSHDWAHHSSRTVPLRYPIDEDEDEARLRPLDDDDLEVISQRQSVGGAGVAEKGKEKVAFCPLCLRPLPPVRPAPGRDVPLRKNTSYFALLSEANSRTNSPRPTRTNLPETPRPKSPDASTTGPAELPESSFNTGYYSRFFSEIRQLGKGGNGTVVLVRHVLNGESLGLYACKKIAIGATSSRLPQLLREVHLLETLQHRNLIIYHHSWVENCRFSSYGPTVPALHILMQFANGGSLSSYISRRRGSGEEDFLNSKEERVRRYRMHNLGAVHLLRLDEILGIFEDCTEGLRYLHARGILHLDLKAENVLLTWEEDALLFVGGSGTLDWTPPESWERDPKSRRLRTPERATDLWALGLILHLLCFFHLPFKSEEPEQLEAEIRSYPGFFPADAHALDHGHHIPPSLLRILSRLIHRSPSRRASCDEVSAMIQKIREEDLEVHLATVLPSSSELSYVNPQMVQAPGSLPLETSALVTQQRTPSPGRNIVPLPDVILEEEEPLLPPPLLDPTGHTKFDAPLHRFPSPLVAAQLLVVFLVLFKVLSTERLCGTSFLSRKGLYTLVLPLLLETLVVRDIRVSLFLLGCHFASLAWLGRAHFCGAPVLLQFDTP